MLHCWLVMKALQCVLSVKDEITSCGNCISNQRLEFILLHKISSELTGDVGGLHAKQSSCSTSLEV